MQYNPERALELLRLGTGNRNATFREGQEDAIRHIVDGRGRLLVVQKTGWGKSSVYFIACKLLREGGLGPGILFSPLLALMRNQISAAERMGVCAITINSDNRDDWEYVEEQLRRGAVDVLLVSPERLANEHFRNEVLAPIAPTVSLVVIDEAHCISDWGHDFRPHYRLIGRMLGNLPPNLRVLATTATANNRVMEDLTAILGPHIAVSKGSLDRPSLNLQTISLPSQSARLAWIVGALRTIEGHGIIYTLTVRDAEMLARWLRLQGFDVEAYTGQTGDQRPFLESALLENRHKALVATTALGMGFDKPDLSFVIHYQMPGSVVAYYQQVGRAGRAVPAAYGVLLSGKEDDDILEYFVKTAFPTRDEVNAVLDAITRHPEGLTAFAIENFVNIQHGRIEKALLLLSMEESPPIAKDGNRWQLTASALRESFWERAERLTRLRREEAQQMRDYVKVPFGQHMTFLVRALDGDPTAIRPPGAPPLSPNIDPLLVQEALRFLRHLDVPLEPRKKWPQSGLPVFNLKGTIPEALRACEGRALSFWGDAGWGSEVKDGKYGDGRFSDELVEASVELLRNWNPQPAPEWLTYVPSLRHPDLVPDFARRLGTRLGLPCIETLRKTIDRPEQKTMQNSAKQARNLDGSLAVVDGSVRTGPVLVVDDMVDSGWTFTICAWLLRTNGSGSVWPLALSRTGTAQ